LTSPAPTRIGFSRFEVYDGAPAELSPILQILSEEAVEPGKSRVEAQPTSSLNTDLTARRKGKGILRLKTCAKALLNL